MPETTISPMYEINTAVYLSNLSKSYGRKIKLDNITDLELNRLVELGVKSVWLMGVWQRSTVSKDMALSNKVLMAELSELVANYSPEDVIGSAYSISDYSINQDFGGLEALKKFREQLSKYGIKLILDFVPNHVSIDNVWVKELPELFILGDKKELRDTPEDYVEIEGRIHANGRDPSLPPWTDVVQLNAFAEGYRAKSIQVLKDIVNICDGVRCDMSMLLLNRIFLNTWGDKAGKVPDREYWSEVIASTKGISPDFIFIAEAYWDTQAELIKEGFNYCYDKTLYDLLREGVSTPITQHLSNTSSYRKHLLSFIENHDENRAAETFEEEKAVAATSILLSLSGVTLLHDGQLEGYKIRIPVHVKRGSNEEVNKKLQKDYEELLAAFRDLNSKNLEKQAIKSNSDDVFAWQMSTSSGAYFIVVNFSNSKTATTLQAEDLSQSLKSLRPQLIYTSVQGGVLEVKHKDNNKLKLTMKPWQVIIYSLSKPKQ